jgi:hypothetical protein
MIIWMNMRAILPRFLSVVALVAFSVAAGASSSCATSATLNAANPTGPFLKEIRQRPDGAIALVYGDQSTLSHTATPRNTYLHAYELDMSQLSPQIGLALAGSVRLPQGVTVDTSQGRPIVQIAQDKIPGHWRPDFDQPGVNPADASAQLAPWFAEDVTVTPPFRTVSWIGADGTHELRFSNATWPVHHAAAYLLLPPAAAFDLATLPFQIPFIHVDD